MTTSTPAYRVISGPLCRMRPDTTTTCKVEGAAEGTHHFVRNRDWSGYSCSHNCGTRVEFGTPEETSNG